MWGSKQKRIRHQHNEHNEQPEFTVNRQKQRQEPRNDICVINLVIKAATGIKGNWPGSALLGSACSLLLIGCSPLIRRSQQAWFLGLTYTLSRFPVNLNEQSGTGQWSASNLRRPAMIRDRLSDGCLYPHDYEIDN